MTTLYEEQSVEGDIASPKYDIYTPTATQKYRLGTRYHKADGRSFYYAKAGTTALVRGNLLQSAVDCFTANEQQDLSIETASAVGDDFGYATTGTDAITEDQLKDGWYIVSDDTVAAGGAQIYQIKSHPAGAAGSTKFTFYDKIGVLISTDSKAGLIMSPYSGVVQCPTTATGWLVGVAMTAVTASYYCWIQTWGMASILAAGALAIGESIVRGPAIAGACAAQDAGAGADEYEIIGHAGHSTDDTDWGFVYLQIAW